MAGVDTGVRIINDDFTRPVTFVSGVPEGRTGWTIDDFSIVGTPTYVTINSDSGQLQISLDAAVNESQIITLYHNDIKSFKSENIQSVSWDVSVSGVDTNTRLVMGIGSDRDNDTDAMTESAWFKIAGVASLTNLVVETDDGTINNDDVATGQTLGDTIKRCETNFEFGLGDVRFFVEDDDGQRTRVAQTTTFNMSNAGRLQPFLQFTKSSGFGGQVLTIDNFRLVYKKD